MSIITLDEFIQLKRKNDKPLHPSYQAKAQILKEQFGEDHLLLTCRIYYAELVRRLGHSSLTPEEHHKYRNLYYEAQDYTLNRYLYILTTST